MDFKKAILLSKYQMTFEHLRENIKLPRKRRKRTMEPVLTCSSKFRD